MKTLYAWFAQAGRLPVALPPGTDAEEYRFVLTGQRPGGARGRGRPQMMLPQWVELEDGSLANMAQIVRLEVADG